MGVWLSLHTKKNQVTAPGRGPCFGQLKQLSEGVPPQLRPAMHLRRHRNGAVVLGRPSLSA